MPAERHSTPVLAILLLTFAAALPAAAEPGPSCGPAEPLASGAGLPPLPAPPEDGLLAGLAAAQPTTVGERVVFAADDRAHGAEPWVSDGTAEGTGLLLDLCPGGCSSAPRFERVLAGELYFWATEPAHGRELWATDGTAAGTRRVTELCPGPCDARPPALWWQDEESLEATAPRGVVLGGRLIFTTRGAGDAGVWATEGAAVTRLADSSPTSVPGPFVTDGEWAYYTVFGTNLRRTDGTPEGTGPFAAEACGFVPFRVSHLTPYQGGLAFTAQCSTNSRERLAVADAQGEMVVTPGIGLVRPVVVDGVLHALTWDAETHRLERWENGALVPLAAFPVHWREPVAAFAGRALFAGQPEDLQEPSGLFALSLDGSLERLSHGPADVEWIEVLDGHALFASHADGQPGAWDLWVTGGTRATTRRLQTFRSTPAVAGGGERLTLPPQVAVAAGEAFVAADGPEARGLRSFSLATLEDGNCRPGADCLCLGGDRFEARVRWENHHTDSVVEPVGDATGSPETGASGYFWFFRPGNLEVLVKVLDGVGVNGHHWVFHGSMTDLRYWLQVHDFAAGTTRVYERPAGSLCGGADVAAFPAAPAADPAAAAARAPITPVPPRCTPGGDDLCLGEDGRFQVTVTFEDHRNAPGVEQTAHGTPESEDSGAFWFFRPDNLEVLVKVLDGTPVNGYLWVFVGAMTDLEFEVEVLDTITGHTWRRTRPQGSLCGIADTRAL